MEVKPNGTVITATYDDQDRLLQYGDFTFTYTANGELTSKCQHNSCQYFDYDVFGNLRHVILDNGLELEYVIDGKNRRVGKKINGSLVQGFVFDDQLRIAAELDGQNQVVATFIYADHINVPEVLEKGGRAYRLLHDHLGSPRFVVATQTGEVVQELQYDAWGNITYDSNPGFQPFGFAGGLYDTHTKLLRFGARDYDPQVGRWTAKDPELFYGGQANLASYCAQDPINNVDPEGTTLWGICRWLWKKLLIVGTANSVMKCVYGQVHCDQNVWGKCKTACPHVKEVCLRTGHKCCTKKLGKCLLSAAGFGSFSERDWEECWAALPPNCPHHGPPPELGPACPQET